MSESYGVSQTPEIYSVGDLMGGIKRLLEDRVGRLWVVGEISNLHRARSGHMYFTLKDDAGQIRAAMFRGAGRKLAFDPEDGLEVLVHGEITVYEARGDLQIIVRSLEPRGQGALQLAFEQLRARLEGEGLFDPARKRALPERPGRLGIVASPTSAAIRDVLQVTARRAPSTPILIAPTRVQGAGADLEVAAALDALSAHAGVDVILLVRGGGSLEDLQAFNSEAVARAIVRTPVPVVCGVGHEVDVTIADLAADLRAPTPSAAAELAVPDRSALRTSLINRWERLCQAIAADLERRNARFDRDRDALRGLAPLARLVAQRERLVASRHALERAAVATLAQSRARFTALVGRVESLSPLAVLSRGYALVRRADNGEIVRRADQLQPGERLAIRVAEAELEVAVETVRPLPVS